MKTAILSTGSELVRGAITDTNASWIARHLREIGIQTDRFVVIGDDCSHLTQTLVSLWDSHELVICTGGLGPTSDDITARAVADALSVPLVRSAEAEQQIKERFSERSFPMAAINLKQADLPEGCRILENSAGTAPGFSVHASQCVSMFLPGVPSEMKVMFHRHVVPLVAPRGRRLFSRSCRTFGIGESQLQERLMPVESGYPDVTFSYRAAYPEITITISGENDVQVNAVHREIQAQLSPFVFSMKNRSLPEVVGALLQQQGHTIATAESCTGGMICNELTHVPGSSEYVRGAVVAYDNAIKTGVLKVNETVLAEYGAVSEQVVREMVMGVKRLMDSSVALATSGIAGPGGGTPDKPVGTVHIAVVMNDVILHKKCLFKGYSRTKVKTASTWTALNMLYHELMEKK
jgi:nicotinamide-nucleotide amidase